MATKHFTNETVVEAAQRRMAWIFDHFEQINCSVSGGKDSTVLAHLALEEAKRRGRKVGLFFLDEEAMYQASVEMVEHICSLYREHIQLYWLQLPFALTNATSLTQGQLHCWEPGKHKLWMRPRRSDSIHHPMWDKNKQTVRNRTKGFGFYDVIDNFERCFSGAAFLVGLRASGESPNRWRAVVQHPITHAGQRIYWGTRRGDNVALYPLYDWNAHDVWRYIYDHKLRYSRIYDLQFRKGYPISEMRVSSLIHERAYKSLCDLPEFEPKTYAALLRRIQGIALAQEQGRSAKLFRARKLPKNFATWRAYRDFLLATHPNEDHRRLFAARFAAQLDNEYVARQQCRQLLHNDYENNLPIDSRPDPRDELLAYYRTVL